MTARAATFWSELLDLSPLHRDSLLAPGAPPLGRREFDVQTAFRSVLDRYFDAACLGAIAARLAARGRQEVLPDLLIGAADAIGVHDVGAGDLSVPETARTRALEPDPDQRAEMTNEMVFRGREILGPGRPPGAPSLVDLLIASAAIPEIMRGIDARIAGRDTVLWDGLYATNPPIYHLPDIQRSAGCPDHDPQEIWVIRINPMRIAAAPTEGAAIADRRNELSGNLPLLQEIRHVQVMGGMTRDANTNKARSYNHVVFGFIDMPVELAKGLDLASKLDASLPAIGPLFAAGRAAMADFLDRWGAPAP